MNFIRRVLIAIIVSCFLTLPITAFGGGTFVIVTKPKLGFKEGSTVYTLGQSISAFLADFGPAEVITLDTYDENEAQLFSQDEYDRQYLANTKTHGYVNDGIAITENKFGTIKGIYFYLIPDKPKKSANVKTDEGVTSGSSLREIIKIYGEPFKQKEDEFLRYKNTDIYYKYGYDVLCFNFKNGVLNTISLNAELLPYLSSWGL